MNLLVFPVNFTQDLSFWSEACFTIYASYKAFTNSLASALSRDLGFSVLCPKETFSGSHRNLNNKSEAYHKPNNNLNPNASAMNRILILLSCHVIKKVFLLETSQRSVLALCHVSDSALNTSHEAISKRPGPFFKDPWRGGNEQSYSVF